MALCTRSKHSLVLRAAETRLQEHGLEEAPATPELGSAPHPAKRQLLPFPAGTRDGSGTRPARGTPPRPQTARHISPKRMRLHHPLAKRKRISHLLHFRQGRKLLLSCQNSPLWDNMAQVTSRAAAKGPFLSWGLVFDPARQGWTTSTQAPAARGGQNPAGLVAMPSAGRGRRTRWGGRDGRAGVPRRQEQEGSLWPVPWSWWLLLSAVQVAGSAAGWRKAALGVRYGGVPQDVTDACSPQAPPLLRASQHPWPPQDVSSWPSAADCPSGTRAAAAQGLNAPRWSAAAAEQMAGGTWGWKGHPQEQKQRARKVQTLIRPPCLPHLHFCSCSGPRGTTDRAGARPLLRPGPQQQAPLTREEGAQHNPWFHRTESWKH